MKKLIAVLLIIVATGAGWWYFGRSDDEEVNPFRFVEIEQGDLESLVASTGKLEPVTTVQVGTQVSGIISEIYVDFNDPVRRGQIIALLDTTLLVAAVLDARANMERTQAQLEHTKREYERIAGLHEKQVVTDVEFNTARYNYETAQAASKSSQISLERAIRNMDYATIRAPISGTVVERNVDVGQTVAASFSAPQLFLIANDLKAMQILANVDESDIGVIEDGQVVRFTVQAYPDDTFTGTVRQVRLQSTIEENVVNYTVVVDVPNEEGRLLPGMTATVDFVIDKVENVLKVPNAALRFRATQWMMAEVQAQREQEMANQPDSVREQRAARRGQRGAQGGNQGDGTFVGGFGGGQGGGWTGGPGGGRRDFTMLWYLDENGQLAMTPARTGLTDGQMTEVMGRNLEPGMQIIAGVTRMDEEEGSNNPFQQNNNRGFRPGGF